MLSHKINQRKSRLKILGFTLVELIVVITILAILATIAFLSFQGYNKNARDSARGSDIAMVNRSLELYAAVADTFPDPSVPASGALTTVTYSGANVWSQGSIGDSVINTVGKVSKKPVDPLTGIEYTYSVNASKKEYQIKADMEEGLLTGYNSSNFFSASKELAGVVIPDVSAASVYPYLKGNFNEVWTKVSTGNTLNILATPGIITSGSGNLDYFTLTGSILCAGKQNCTVTFTPTVVYSSGTTLPGADTEIQTFVTNLQIAYTGSSVSTSPVIAQILAATTPTAQVALGTNLIKNKGSGGTSTSTGTCIFDAGKFDNCTFQ